MKSASALFSALRWVSCMDWCECTVVIDFFQKVCTKNISIPHSQINLKLAWWLYWSAVTPRQFVFFLSFFLFFFWKISEEFPPTTLQVKAFEDFFPKSKLIRLQWSGSELWRTKKKNQMQNSCCLAENKPTGPRKERCQDAAVNKMLPCCRCTGCGGIWWPSAISIRSPFRCQMSLEMIFTAPYSPSKAPPPSFCFW